MQNTQQLFHTPSFFVSSHPEKKVWPPSVTTCQLACSPLVPWEPIYTLLHVNHTERGTITTPIIIHISLSLSFSLSAVLNSLIIEPLLLPALLHGPSIHRDLPPPPHLPSLSPGNRISAWGGEARQTWNYVSALFAEKHIDSPTTLSPG